MERGGTFSIEGGLTMAHSATRFALWLLVFVLFAAGIFREFVISAQGGFQKAVSTIRQVGVSSMEQLSPGVGWAIASGHLVWTNDGGGAWTDLTPPGLANGTIHNVFFLDVEHAWIVTVAESGTWYSGNPVRIFQTTDRGRTWVSHTFDESSYPSLKQAGAMPVSLSFADSRHGWFLWRLQTSAAFSAGKMFGTNNGGETWTELPEPPSAGMFRFHTPQDGWMVTGGGSETLSVTNDGGRTWQARSVPPPESCLQCRPVFTAPIFQNPSEAVLTVTYVDDQAPKGRYVSSTYLTYDGGNSWQRTEAYEQTGRYPKTGFTSIVGMHAIRVFSDAVHGTQIRSGARITNPSYSEKLPPRGFVAGADFADDSNGWFIYHSVKCVQFRNRDKDGPGLPCLVVVDRDDLVATTDAGGTLKVITPPLPPVAGAMADPAVKGTLRPVP